MLSLARRVILQISGDKRTMALIIAAPILVMTLLYLLLGKVVYTPAIAVSGNGVNPVMLNALESADAKIISGAAISDLARYLKDNRNVDAVLSFSGVSPVITMYESSAKSSKALKIIEDAAASVNPAFKITTEFVIGKPDDSTFNSLGYVFLGVISFFFNFLIAGIALVRERSSGTLERMLMTPVKRRAVIGGYTLGIGFFAAIQAVVITLYSVYALGLKSSGSIAYVALAQLLLAAAAVSFGELISIFAASEFQVMQFVPVAIIPQIFFSGLIPVDTLPYHLGVLCYIMPVFYGCRAIKEVMTASGGIAAIWPYLAALCAYIAAFGVLNAFALKKYRGI